MAYRRTRRLVDFMNRCFCLHLWKQRPGFRAAALRGSPTWVWRCWLYSGRWTSRHVLQLSDDKKQVVHLVVKFGHYAVLKFEALFPVGQCPVMLSKMSMKQKAYVRIRIPHGEDFAIGPGKAILLEAIQRTGSISAAGRELKMSYRRAWLLVDSMNRCFREPLVTTATGGRSGGGAQITDHGLDVLERFRAMEAKARTAIDSDLDYFFRLLARK